MAAKQTIWVAGDRERRQHISREVHQLKLMSKTLRTRAMQSFMKRIAAARLDIPRLVTDKKHVFRAESLFLHRLANLPRLAEQARTTSHEIENLEIVIFQEHTH